MRFILTVKTETELRIATRHAMKIMQDPPPLGKTAWATGTRCPVDDHDHYIAETFVMKTGAGWSIRTQEVSYDHPLADEKPVA